MIETSFRLTQHECINILEERLSETPPAKIQIVTGPRQVGKTDMLIKLTKKFKKKALYTAADSPESALPGYWERLWQKIRDIELEQGEAFLFIDEIQHLKDWSVRLKGEWDKVLRQKEKIHLVASGSSALHLGKGSQESLAGRIERLTVSHWSLSTLKKSFSLTKEQAADQIVTMGAYPGSMPFIHDLHRWSSYIREAIIEPAISHDIFNLCDVRRPALLKQVFALASSSPAQIISLNKLQGQLQDKGALDTISQYLGLFEDSFLIAALDKYASQPIRRKASPPKLIALSNALPAIMDPRGIPSRATDPARFGLWVENAVLAFAWNSGQKLYYWREGNVEVDGVIEGSWGNWALEIKTSSFINSDLKGLLEFTQSYPKFKPLVICDKKDVLRTKKLGIEAISWIDFLSSGPPKN